METFKDITCDGTDPPHIASPKELEFILVPALGFLNERAAKSHLRTMNGERDNADILFHRHDENERWYVTRPWVKSERAARKFLSTDVLFTAENGLPFQSAVLWNKDGTGFPNNAFHTALAISGPRNVCGKRNAYMEWRHGSHDHAESIVQTKRIYSWRYGRGVLYARDLSTSTQVGTTKILLLAFKIMDEDPKQNPILFLKLVRRAKSTLGVPDVSDLPNFNEWRELIERAKIGFETECAS